MPATYDKLFSTTVTGSATNTVDFSNIPQTYTDLVIVTIGTETDSAYGIWRLNNDSGTNYSRVYMLYNGAGFGTAINSTISAFYWNGESNSTGRCINYIEINNYAETTGTKQIIQNDGQGASTIILTNERWNSTAAINRITFLSAGGGNYISVGTNFTIYGIKKV